MSDRPPIHIIRDENSRFDRICFSRMVKWIGGIVAGLITALLISAVGFAWHNNERLAKLDDMPNQIKDLTTAVQNNNSRLSKIEGRLEGVGGL